MRGLCPSPGLARAAIACLPLSILSFAYSAVASFPGSGLGAGGWGSALWGSFAKGGSPKVAIGARSYLEVSTSIRSAALRSNCDHMRTEPSRTAEKPVAEGMTDEVTCEMFETSCVARSWNRIVAGGLEAVTSIQRIPLSMTAQLLAVTVPVLGTLASGAAGDGDTHRPHLYARGRSRPISHPGIRTPRSRRFG